MKTLVLVVSLLLAVPVWGAEKVVGEVSWEQFQKEGQILSGEMITEASSGLVCLRVVHSASGAVTLPLAVLDAPKITRSEYALEGEVRYEGVEGEGYLETWNYFGETERYFSRTLSPAGLMGVLSGTSGWRPFRLPFFTNNNTKHPSKIEFNLVLPGRGTVYLRGIRLVESKAWWSEQQSGWLGAIMGCLGGLFGIMGSISGALAAKGKGRGVAFGTLYSMAGTGGLLLMLGLCSVTLEQPYHVYCPLLLGGGLFLILGLVLIPQLKRTFEQVEIRKMKSMDVG